MVADSQNTGAPPPTSPPRPRRRARDRSDPAGDRRRRVLMAVAGVAIAAVVALYLLVFQDGQPKPPSGELALFSTAVDDRDVDALVAMWHAESAPDDVAAHVREVFEMIGQRGNTPSIGRPRVRPVDARTWRSIHRIGEIDLEVRWVQDGERFSIVAFDLAR